MKILIPCNDSKNDFLYEIQLILESFSIVQLSKDLFFKPSSDFDIVFIQWPEALCDWYESDAIFIEEVRTVISKWKSQNVKLVYLRHNSLPHHNNSVFYQKLYELIITSVDSIVHMGRESLDEFKPLILQCKQVVIEHPLFINSYKGESKIYAREKLGIKKSKKVILCLGRVRNLDELSFITSTFKQINLNNKLLMVPRYNYKGVPLWRNNFIRWLSWRISYCFRNISGKYILRTRTLEREEVSTWVAASDILFIARKKLLNSGQLYLGLTLDKPMFAPYTGNLKEQIDNFNIGSFKLNHPYKEIALCLENRLKSENERIYISDKKQFNEALKVRYKEHFESIVK